MDSQTTTRTRFAAAICLSLASTFARGSWASPSYPDAVEKHLGLNYTPDCLLCHDGDPGIGTATTPFAAAMRRRGLVPNNTAALAGALDALAGEQTDSDFDGVGDIEELRRGRDPNLPNLEDGGVAPGAAPPEVIIPTYGCSISTAGARHDGSGLLVAAAACFAMLCARRFGTSPLPPGTER